MLRKSGSGQSTIEYVVIVAIIVGLIVLLLGRFKSHVGGASSHLSGQISAALQ